MLPCEIYLGVGYAIHTASQVDQLLNYFEQDTSQEVKEPSATGQINVTSQSQITFTLFKTSPIFPCPEPEEASPRYSILFI